MLRRLLLAAPAAVLAAAFVLTGAGAWGPAAAGTPSDVAPCTSASASPAPVVSPTFGIQAFDSSFDPSLPTVRRGTTVVWSLTNTSLHHTVTDTAGWLDSGNLDPGASCSFTFTAAGDYDYFCVYHTNMTGDATAALDEFARSGGIMLSINCLDEGVDIPRISHALILASSTTRREFIQRRCQNGDAALGALPGARSQSRGRHVSPF